jgi:glycosyltransferase involved in cell wall biosynthesis
MSTHPEIAILMSTYNGAKYISQQLESIELQTHSDWTLYVSDDGSKDETLDIIKGISKQWSKNKCRLLVGPKKGFCQNFLSLACNKSIQADYYAFSDQDDVWDKNKLKVALNKLREIEIPNMPALYFGRTTYTKEDLTPYGASKKMRRPMAFRNAILQSVAGGNTVLFNQAAKKLIETIGLVPAISHDWWLYQLITGAGGKVYYDETPYVLYRQHENALIGGNTSFYSKCKRILNVVNDQFKEWCNQNIECFLIARPYFTAENNQLVDQLIQIRKSSLCKRTFGIFNTGIYRQTTLGTLGIIIAVIFNKI